MPREARTIRALRANVTEPEAVSVFCAGLSGWLRQAQIGSLRSVAAAYVPFRLFEVEVLNRGESQRLLFALDGFSGSLDLFAFSSAPGDAELTTIETCNALPSMLGDDQAVSMLRTNVERLLFQTGFFRIRGLHIGVRDALHELYVPYWLGFFGHGKMARLRVLDAVRRRMEGAKAQDLFMDWLSAPGRI